METDRVPRFTQLTTRRPRCANRDEEFKQGLLFQPGDKEVRCVWVKFSKVIPDCDIEPQYTTVDLVNALAITEDEKKSSEMTFEAPNWSDITTDMVNGAVLPYTIRLHSRDGFLPSSNVDEKAMFNQAANELLHLPKHMHAWKGPVLAYGIQKFTEDSHLKKGVSICSPESQDLHHIANFLNSLHAPVRMVSCVRINCWGDREKGRPKLEVINLPAHHGIFQQAAGPITELIGLPVAAAKIPGNLEIWRKLDKLTNNYVHGDNYSVHDLYTRCEPPSNFQDFIKEKFILGQAPNTWESPVGSCIAARKDRKDLHPDHFEGLMQFIAGLEDALYDLRGELECFDDSGDDEDDEDIGDSIDIDTYALRYSEFVKSVKEQVAALIKKDDFKKFWNDWRAEQTDLDKKMRLSPFDA